MDKTCAAVGFVIAITCALACDAPAKATGPSNLRVVDRLEDSKFGVLSVVEDTKRGVTCYVTDGSYSGGVWCK